jgi:hypothetical protein
MTGIECDAEPMRCYVRIGTNRGFQRSGPGLNMLVSLSLLLPSQSEHNLALHQETTAKWPVALHGYLLPNTTSGENNLPIGPNRVPRTLHAVILYAVVLCTYV